MAGRPSASHRIPSYYPSQFVDTAGNVISKRQDTKTGGPGTSSFYYTEPTQPGMPGYLGDQKPGASNLSIPNLPGTTGGTLPAQVKPPTTPQQVAAPNAPPPVAPIDINAILSQWQGMMRPTLPREAEIPYIPDTEAAQAAYNRAKDTAGQQGRGALDALMDVQGARGIVGSGLGVNEAGGVIGAVNQNLADVNREQLIQAYNTELARQQANAGLRVTQRGQDIDQQGLNNALLGQLGNLHGLQQQSALTQRGQNIDVLGMGYQGGIDQRGQNIDMLNTGYQGAITQRNQDLGILEALIRKQY